MAVGSNSGSMAQSTKVTGIRTRLMVEVDLYMLTETFMRDNGMKTRRMATDTTIMLTELNTRESGVMISSMARVKRFGQTMPSILEGMLTARRRGQELSTGQMGPLTQVIL